MTAAVNSLRVDDPPMSLVRTWVSDTLTVRDKWGGGGWSARGRVEMRFSETVRTSGGSLNVARETKV